MSDIIFSVDVETSGPTPGVHHLLSIGAIAYDTEGFMYDVFSHNIERSPQYTDDADTTQWWMTQPEARVALEDDQLPLAAVMQEFAFFIKNQCSAGGNPVFLADPVIFDYPWIDWAFKTCSVKNPFHFDSKYGLKVIDMTSFVMGGFGILNTARHELMNAYDVGLPPHTHIAVEDARHQGELFFKLARKLGWPRA